MATMAVDPRICAEPPLLPGVGVAEAEGTMLAAVEAGVNCGSVLDWTAEVGATDTVRALALLETCM